MDRQVTERDFRLPEFYNAKPEDYEFRHDGAIVRKDRWETGIRRIAGILGWSREEWEIDAVVEGVQRAVDGLPPKGFVGLDEVQELRDALAPFVRVYRQVEGREEGCPRAFLRFEHHGKTYAPHSISIEEFEAADEAVTMFETLIAPQPSEVPTHGE